eukprot:jgi/Galph1/2157/GphlegSOOS_G832.1
MASNNVSGSSHLPPRTQNNKSKTFEKGELAAKLASLPYSFSQTLPAVTRKTSSNFDRNFPLLDSHKNSHSSTNRTGFKGAKLTGDTREHLDASNSPTVAEIVAGVSRSSKVSSEEENPDNKKEPPESIPLEQLERHLYSRLIPATNTSKGTSKKQTPANASHLFNTSIPRSHVKNKERLVGNQVVKNNRFYQEATIDRSSQQHALNPRNKSSNDLTVEQKHLFVQSGEGQSSKSSWNVLRSTKTTRPVATHATPVENNLHGSSHISEMNNDMNKSLEVDKSSQEPNCYQTVENNSLAISKYSSVPENLKREETLEAKEDNSVSPDRDSEVPPAVDDHEKFESLLRSMGWNPENGELGEEITEEEKAQWLQRHAGISSSNLTLSANNIKFSNKLGCFTSSVTSVNSLQTTSLRLEETSVTDSEEASSSEYDD